MKPQTPLRLARSLTLQFDADGALLARVSPSAVPVALEPETVIVLRAFARGAEPAAARAALAEAYELEPEEFDGLLGELLRAGLLRPLGDGAARTLPGATGSFGDWSHFRMLADTTRVEAYRRALRRHAAGKRVLDIGCGSGILSLLALQAGAREVVAVEEGAIAEVAERVFADNGVSHRVTLRRCNSTELELQRPAELIVHELLGDQALDENVLPYIEDARRRLLAPGGRLLPGRIQLCCVGIAAGEKPPFESPGRLAAQGAALGARYGVELGAFFRSLAARRRRVLVSPAREEEVRLPPVLSEECVLLDIDLGGDLARALEPRRAELRICRDGRLGGVLLYLRAWLDSTITLDNAPGGPTTSWSWDLRLFPGEQPVRAGDAVGLAVEVAYERGEQGVEVSPI